MADTGIEPKRLANWFVNNRKRYWKPRVESKLHKYNAPAGSLPSLNQVASGLSIPTIPKPSLHQQQQKQAAAKPVPMLSKPAASLLLLARASGGPARRSHADLVPPAGGVAPGQAAADQSREDDPHTISEGSGSSACNSDDESIGTSSSGHRTSLVASSACQYPNSPLVAVRDSSSSETTDVPMSGGRQRKEESGTNASFTHGFTIHLISPPISTDGVHVKTSPRLPRSRTYESADLDLHGNNSNPAPRKRARISSKSSLKGVDKWRELCKNAESLFCESLPSLEEAVVMFGY